MANHFIWRDLILLTKNSIPNPKVNNKRNAKIKSKGPQSNAAFPSSCSRNGINKSTRTMNKMTNCARRIFTLMTAKVKANNSNFRILVTFFCFHVDKYKWANEVYPFCCFEYDFQGNCLFHGYLDLRKRNL